MPTVLSLFSRRHRQSPATSPALLHVATSLSTSAIHPPSPFSLSSCSRCRPTATTLPPPLSLSSLRPLHIRSLSLRLDIVDCHRLLSLTSTVGLFLRRGRYRCRLLSLFFAALPLPPRILLWVISASARTSMALKLVALDPPPPLVHSLSLFSTLASAPSSLIDAAAVASFTVASTPPTRTLCHRRLPYSSSTDVIAASLFLHRCPASPPVTQEDPRPPAPPPLLVSASVHCHGLEPKMGIG